MRKVKNGGFVLRTPNTNIPKISSKSAQVNIQTFRKFTILSDSYTLQLRQVEICEKVVAGEPKLKPKSGFSIANVSTVKPRIVPDFSPHHNIFYVTRQNVIYILQLLKRFH
jgi:hypothetical protein